MGFTEGSVIDPRSAAEAPHILSFTKHRSQPAQSRPRELSRVSLLAAQLAPVAAGAFFLHPEPPRAGKSAGELRRHLQLFEAPAAALDRCTRQRTS